MTTDFCLAEMEGLDGAVGAMMIPVEEVMAVVVMAVTERTLHFLSELVWWQGRGDLVILEKVEVEEESSSMERNHFVGILLMEKDSVLVEENGTVMDILELFLSKLNSKSINKYNRGF